MEIFAYPLSFLSSAKLIPFLLCGNATVACAPEKHKA